MRRDGTYARLVRLQARMSQSESLQSVLDSPPAEEPKEEASEIRWFEPQNIALRAGPHQSLDVTLPDGRTERGAFAVRCFPATRPSDFISLRYRDAAGRERELGILRKLDDWPTPDRELIQRSLCRQHCYRTIEAIDGIQLGYGHLTFQVRTAEGPETFVMRWNQASVQDFGTSGRVLLDVEDNRYLVPDLARLAELERALFERFVYW